MAGWPGGPHSVDVSAKLVGALLSASASSSADAAPGGTDVTADDNAREQEAVGDALNALFDGCERVIVFDASGEVLGTGGQGTGSVTRDELRATAAVFEDRDAAMSSGVVLEGQRYEVHRWHPPCVYGRTTTERSEDSVGFAVCRVASRSCEPARLVLATYAFPRLSARVVPELVEFAQHFLGLPEPVWEGLKY